MRDENLKALKTRFPEIWSEIQKPDSATPKTNFHATSEAPQEALLEIKTPQRTLLPYGTIDPHIIVRHWLDNLGPLQETFVISSGLGSGLQAIEFLKKYPSTTGIAIIEPHIDLLKQSLSHFDLSDLLLNDRFLLLTPQSKMSTIRRMNKAISWIKGAQSKLFTPLATLSPQLYINESKEVLKLITTRWTQVNTDVQRSMTCMDNIYTNYQKHWESPEISHLKNIFKGKTLVLAAAGPSLDDSIDFIKEIRSKIVLASVNSSYRKLINQGLKPDFTVAVDPMEGTYLGYKDCSTEDIYLMAPFSVYPHVMDTFSGKIINIQCHQKLVAELHSHVQHRPPMNVLGDGTVSATVINLSIHFGCNQVILVGQDFAIRENGISHTEDSFYSDLNANKVDLKDCIWVKGNCQDKVPSQPKLLEYKHIFESILSENKNIRVYNTSTIGAQLEGAPFKPREDIAKSLRESPSINARECLHQKMQKKEEKAQKNQPKILAYLERFQHFCQQIQNATLKASIQSEYLFSQPETIAEEELNALKKQWSQAQELSAKQPEFNKILLEGKGKLSLFQYYKDALNYPNLSPDKKQLLEFGDLLWTYLEASLYHQKRLKALIETFQAMNKNDVRPRLERGSPQT